MINNFKRGLVPFRFAKAEAEKVQDPLIVRLENKMRPAKITIISHAQTADSDTTTSTVWGQLAERGGKYYAMYEEPASSGLEGTKTTLKWDANSIIVLRTGLLKHRQELRVGLIDESLYQTPYLTISIKTVTSTLQVFLSPQGWHLSVAYRMEVGGDEPREICLDILIEEDKTSEYKGTFSTKH